MDNRAIIAVCVVAVVWITAHTYLKIRPFRSEERLAALAKGQNPSLFFSGRLLQYIPWPFWTSFGILVVLITAYFLSVWLSSAKGQEGFLELIKYTTGAVVGSLFGKAKRKEPQTESGKN